MIRTAFVAFAIVAAGPALAGGVTEPQPSPIVPVAPAFSGSDWTGGYVGLQLETFLDSTLTRGASDSDTDADIYGIFGGYRWDFGNFVLGGELDYMVGDAEVSDPDAFNFDIDSLVRLGVEAGYDFGNVLFYGTLGLAQLELSDQFGVDDDSDGYFYGLGVDYRVNDRWLIGAELLQHEFDDFGLPNELDALSLGLNVGISF